MQTNAHSVIVTYPNDLSLVWYPDSPNYVYLYRTFPDGSIDPMHRKHYYLGTALTLSNVGIGIEWVYNNKVDEYGDENE